MANWSNPALTTSYATFLSELKERDIDAATMFQNTATNIPADAIKWDDTSSTFQRYNHDSSGVWETLPVTGSGSGDITLNDSLVDTDVVWSSSKINSTFLQDSSNTTVTGEYTLKGLEIPSGYRILLDSSMLLFYASDGAWGNQNLPVSGMWYNYGTKTYNFTHNQVYKAAGNANIAVGNVYESNIKLEEKYLQKNTTTSQTVEAPIHISNSATIAASDGILALGNLSSTHMVFDWNDIEARDDDGANTLRFNYVRGGDIRLGNSSSTVYVAGTFSNTSDERDKSNIEDSSLGLEFINSLRPRDFDITPRNEDNENPKRHHGFIAQEVKETMDKLGVDFSGYDDKDPEHLALAMLELINPLVKAVQELSAEVKQLKGE